MTGKKIKSFSEGEMRKVYIDRIKFNGCIAVLVPDAEVISAGTTVYPMDVEYKNEEYQKYADRYDIHFIFYDDVPNPDFYSVPQVDIFARDSEGGLLEQLDRYLI